MPDFPSIGGTMRVEGAGANTAASTGTSLADPGGSNTKGSWTELLASSAFDADGVVLSINNEASAADYLIDFAVGASSSEEVILSNLLLSAGKNYQGISYYFPLHIPVGSRIAARHQGSTSAAISVDINLLEVGFANSPTLQKVTTYGANTADSGGTGIDPGGTANTKGSYSEITSSTTAPIRFMVVAIGSRANTAMSNAHWLVDLAIGSAGSEQPIINNFPVVSNIQADAVLPQTIGFGTYIPAGTRLAARCQCDITDAADRLLDVVVYGVS